MKSGMNRLTERDHWNSLYEQDKHSGKRNKSYNFIDRTSVAIEGNRRMIYSEHLLWNTIYTKYLPKKRGLKVIEVGSAPGHHLVKLYEHYGYTPYGVEYSRNGVMQNRKIFSS